MTPMLVRDVFLIDKPRMNNSHQKPFSTFYPINNPRWPLKDSTWTVGFYIHVYCYGAVFLILLAYSVRIFLYSRQRYNKSKIARIGVYCLTPLILACMFRTLFLFIDPYGFYSSVPILASRILYCSMGPFLSLGFYIEQRLLMRFSSLIFKRSKTNYKLIVLFVHVALLSVSIITEVVIHLHHEFKFLLLFPKIYFIILVIAFCLKFLYLAFKLTNYVEHVHSVAKGIRHTSRLVCHDRSGRKSRKQKSGRDKNEEVELLENTSLSNSSARSSSDDNCDVNTDPKPDSHLLDGNLDNPNTTTLNSLVHRKTKHSDIHSLISHYKRRLFSRNRSSFCTCKCSKKFRLVNGSHSGNCFNKLPLYPFETLSGIDNHVLSPDETIPTSTNAENNSCNRCGKSVSLRQNLTQTGNECQNNRSTFEVPTCDLKKQALNKNHEKLSKSVSEHQNLQHPNQCAGANCDINHRYREGDHDGGNLKSDALLSNHHSSGDNQPTSEHHPLLSNEDNTADRVNICNEAGAHSMTNYANDCYDECEKEMLNPKLVAFRNALSKQEELEIKKILQLFQEYDCDNGYLGDNETSLQNELSSCQVGCDCGNDSEDVSNRPIRAPNITDHKLPNLSLYEFRRAEMLETALQRLYLCVFLFIILCVFESFEVLGPYGIFSTDSHPASWPWLIFHYLYRTSELLIVYVLSSAADVLICRKTTRRQKKILRK